MNIAGISFYLPVAELSNNELEELYEDWPAAKIYDKIGIKKRHIAAEDETAGDLAGKAALKLFGEFAIEPQEIDFILLATQSPDYFLPTTACILQHKLGIPSSAGALDFNLGCSGYVYGLALAKGLISGSIAQNVLLLTGETYSKYIHPRDKSVRTIFGDAGSATLVSRSLKPSIGEFVLGTDGSGFDKLIVPVGGARKLRAAGPPVETKDESGNVRSNENLFMDGAAIFSFTVEKVPEVVRSVLEKNGLAIGQIDLFVFHHANKFMLDFLRNIIDIPKEKFYVNMADIGNTVSSSIPIALRRASDDGILKSGMKVMLVGFGVGLSWGATLVEWK
jgi:3-oxoacyl-[acyl-carrier-protein] synthase-3